MNPNQIIGKNKNKQMKNSIFIGFAVGIVANLMGMFIYTLIFLDYGFVESLKIAQANNALGGIITLGALANFAAFFWFIKKQQLFKARGVLMATILAAIVVVYLRFF